MLHGTEAVGRSAEGPRPSPGASKHAAGTSRGRPGPAVGPWPLGPPLLRDKLWWLRMVRDDKWLIMVGDNG